MFLVTTTILAAARTAQSHVARSVTEWSRVLDCLRDDYLNDDELEGEDYKPPREKRHQCVLPGQDYGKSVWAEMLRNPDLRDCTTRAAMFRSHFRNPYPCFKALVDVMKKGSRSPTAQHDAVGQRCIPVARKARRSITASPARRPQSRSVVGVFFAGMAVAAVLLYANRPGARNSGPPTRVRQKKTEALAYLEAGVHLGKGVAGAADSVGASPEVAAREDGRNALESFGPDAPQQQGRPPKAKQPDGRAEVSEFLFDEADVAAVVGEVARYAAFARSTLEADGAAVEEGRPMQGKYLVLDSGNELANRLRGVLSGFFLGLLTDRVFVADITYQKDATQGLLNSLFEGPGYQWDLSQLPLQLRRKLSPEQGSSARKPGNLKAVHFDMSEEHFKHWVCDDVLGVQASLPPVVTLSTVVYPLPLLARNPTYASHPILAGRPNGEWAGFAGGGQRRIEALETLLTRVVLKPTRELRASAKELADRVREEAVAWGKRRGLEGGRPPRVVGLHVRTYFVKAVSSGTLEENLRQFADCAVAGGGTADAKEVFYFVATDEAKTQDIARKVWGDGCFFVSFGLPGSKLEGIKAALVDLLVMGSLDDYVVTPHSSFSELGATLSQTWRTDVQAALRVLPNRPIVPFFPAMNDFERRKEHSLLDRRAAIVPADARGGVGGGMCMRVYAAGMSVAVAKGTQITSMFEAIEKAPCLKGRLGIDHL